MIGTDPETVHVEMAIPVAIAPDPSNNNAIPVAEALVVSAREDAGIKVEEGLKPIGVPHPLA